MTENKISIKNTFTFRLYAELNDFIPKDKKQKAFQKSFKAPITVRETLISLGIPLSEIDLVLVNGKSVHLSTQLKENDFVSVFPVFETIDISTTTRIRQSGLRKTKFILDAHLGKLAKYLRMLGFDTLYNNNFKDDEIIETAINEQRIILTRDKLLLASDKVSHGYYVRATNKHEQLKEVVYKFDLYSQFKSFTRCMTCNSELQKTDKNNIADRINSEIYEIFNEFYFCIDCQKVFWKGSHFERMEKYIKDLINTGI